MYQYPDQDYNRDNSGEILVSPPLNYHENQADPQYGKVQANNGEMPDALTTDVTPEDIPVPAPYLIPA